MSLDHAQNLRIGQKGASATPGIQLVTLASLPEVAFRGQMVYALDLDEFRVFDGDAWQVPTAATTGGTQTFVGADAPVADAIGDLWLKNTTYQLYIWDGTAWQEVQDPTADAAASAASAAQADALEALGVATDAQATADGKVTSFYQSAEPALPTEDPQQGDIWFRTSDNRAFIYSAGAFVEIQDQDIVTAISDAGTAQATADQKISSYYQTTPPWPDGTAGHGNDIGDLWFDTDDNNKPYRWDGNWTTIRDGSIATASASAATALAAAVAAQSAADTAQATADGAIRTFYQSAAPTGLNSTTNVGDLWFDTDDGQAYRWNGTAWVIIEDNSIAAALAAAQTAQTTADGKITAYYQITAPTIAEVGDLWYDTDDKNKPYFCSAVGPPAVWTAIRDATIADAQATANAALGAATSDGLAPTSSPACEMVGGVGAILFRWTPITNPNVVTYEVHASTTSGFTHGPTTLVGKTLGSQLTMRNLNGGVALAYDTTYYGKVVATDPDGAGPAGVQSFATMVQITTPDVSAAYVYAGQVVADQINTGSLSADVTLSATLRTALSGQRVEIGPLGIITYDSTGTLQTQLPTSGTNIFKGIIEAAGLTAIGAISMRNTGAHEITRGATLTLQGGVTASQSAPSAVVDWETVNLDTVTGLGGMPPSLLGPNHAIAMCGIGARMLVLFKNGSIYGWGTFNSDGSAYTLGPTYGSNSSANYNQIICKSLTSPIILQQGRNLERRSWNGSRTFFDDFSGTLSQWTSTTNTAIASGVARITTPGVGSGNMVGPVRSMTEKKYFAKIVPRFPANPITANQTWSFRAQLDASNYLEIALNPSGVTAGNLRFRYFKAGVATDTVVAFDATNHQWFKIEHNDATIKFFTSAGTASPTWAQQASVTNAFTTVQLDGMHPEITATASGTAIELDIDNFEINWTDRIQFYSSIDTEIPALGTDGTDWWVTELNSASPPAFTINTMSDITMASTSTTTTSTSAGFTGNMSGLVKVTDAAWGAPARWVMASKSPSAQHYWVFNSSTGTYEGGTLAFGLPTGGSKGIAYDGTNFWTLNSSGQLAKHTTNTWTSSADPENWWASFSWYDGNATGGTHETMMSPQASFTMHKRARYTITTPAIPAGLGSTDDVDSVKLFIGRGVSAPARTAMWLQGTSATGTNSMAFNAATFSGTNPLAAGTFVTSGASAGKIRNSDDTLVISGDGSVLASAMSIGTTPVNTLTQVATASLASTFTAPTTEADITGVTVTFSTVRPNAKYMCTISAFMSTTAANTSISQVKLSIDNVVQTATIGYTGSTTGPDRTTNAQTWVGTLVSAGSHTFKARAVTGTAASVNINAPQTTISVLIFE